MCLSNRSKSKHKSAYPCSIDGFIVSHSICNIEWVFTAELMALFSHLSHVSQLHSHGRYLLFPDSFSSLHTLSEFFTTNQLIQRIPLILLPLDSINTQVTFFPMPDYIDPPKYDTVNQQMNYA